MIVMRERADAPAWASQLLSDADSLTSAVFPNRFHAAGISRTLREAIESLAWMPQADPGNYEWSRVAMIVQLLVCSARDLGMVAAHGSPLQRLSAFIEENDDLMDAVA